MRKTVVVLLTSLLLASLPAQGTHAGYPGGSEDGETPGTTVPISDELVKQVAHDCLDERTPSQENPVFAGNDLESVWVGSGVRTGEFDSTSSGSETWRLVLVDVVLYPLAPLDDGGPNARLDIQFEANGVQHRTVIESKADSDTPPEGNEDWQSADAISVVTSGTTLRPLSIQTRETASGGSDPRPARVVELGYYFADVFAPGTDTTSGDLTIDGSWFVESLYGSGSTFSSGDVIPREDPSCSAYKNIESDPLVPEAPTFGPAGVTATPNLNVDRRPDTKVRFHADVIPGGGDRNLDGYSHTWTFTNGDDEIVSTEAEPEIHFSQRGPVSVTLNVVDDLGMETGEMSFEEVAQIGNREPIADFTVNPLAPGVGEEVSFTDSSYDPEGDDIVAWRYDFGDGSEVSTQSDPTHTFTEARAFHVTLTATDEFGASNTRSLTLFVCTEADQDAQTCKPPNLGPTASFTVSSNEVTQGGDITFTDTSTDPDGTISAWHWNFGDGTTSTVQNPTHTFETVGIFQIKLTVTDDGLLQGQRAIPVRVTLAEDDSEDEDKDLLPAPIAAFFVDPEAPIVGKPVTFKDSSNTVTKIVEWTWFFGDGSSPDHNETAIHTYSETGNFRVRLTVVDEHGVRDTHSQIITVSAEADEESPGLPLMLVLGLLVAVAVTRRR